MRELFAAILCLMVLAGATLLAVGDEGYRYFGILPLIPPLATIIIVLAVRKARQPTS